MAKLLGSVLVMLLAIGVGMLVILFIIAAWMKSDQNKQCERQYGLQYWARDTDQCVNKAGEVRYLK